MDCGLVAVAGRNYDDPVFGCSRVIRLRRYAKMVPTWHCEVSAARRHLLMTRLTQCVAYMGFIFNTLTFSYHMNR